MVDTDTGVAPVVSVFVSDLTSDPKTLLVATTDVSLAKTYNLALKVYYLGLEVDTESTKPFLITIDGYCNPTSVIEV